MEGRATQEGNGKHRRAKKEIEEMKQGKKWSLEDDDGI